MGAHIVGIAYHLPQNVVTNEELQRENPDWDMVGLARKLGVEARHVAGPTECASDLALVAARDLLAETAIPPEDIDVLMLCTETPDYLLPPTACLLQERLGLPTRCAAFDFNLGCSGFVYGLYLAKGLIESGLARNVLLLTADTYTRLIHPRDRTVRVLFGDGAAATLVSGDRPGPAVGRLVLGTDGNGAPHLIVPAGGMRLPVGPETGIPREDAGGSVRSLNNLYMNGAEVFSFALRRVPEAVDVLLRREGLSVAEVDAFVFHQANRFMLEQLCRKMGIPPEKAPLFLSGCGNTVSASIPMVLREHWHRFRTGQKVVLVGFGVGYSWGAALVEWA